MNIDELFYIKIVDKRMKAEIYCTESYQDYGGDVTEEQIKQLLTSNQVAFGIHEEVVSSILNKIEYSQFPLTIATGMKPVDGEDGFITYTFDKNTVYKDNKLKKTFDFRDVMDIPNVKENDEIAIETLPTKGKSGKNISGIAIKPRPGRRQVLHAGKNVRHDEENGIYYATAEGQVSTQKTVVHVHNLFVVNDTLSMETGNIDFVGSVEIHGDLPTGYTVNAGGDIRVFGLVEAATLVAGGSVYISEGFAGLQKGRIDADGDVHVSYVNQGNIESRQSIYVKNSILHSMCRSEHSVICEQGNIIGGTITAGFSIQARDIGNRVHTQTRIMIDEDEQMYEKEQELKEELKNVRTTIKQLTLIGEKLQRNSNMNDPKIRVTLLRQKSSLQQAKDKESAIQNNIEMAQENYFHDGEATIIVQNELFENVTIAFGKYERTTLKDYTHVVCQFYGNEITISSL